MLYKREKKKGFASRRKKMVKYLLNSVEPKRPLWVARLSRCEASTETSATVGKFGCCGCITVDSTGFGRWKLSLLE